MTTNQGVMHSFCCAEYESFVDWQGRACHFDSQEFIDLLEYAKEYPSEEEIDWTTQLETESQCELIRQRKLLFMGVDGLEMLLLPQYEELFDGEIQFAGSPYDMTRGMGIMVNTDYGIAESSTCKEGAWAFLRTLLTQEAMTENPTNAYYGQLPTRKDALESVFKWYFTKVPYTDAYGREIYPMDQYAWGLDDTEVHIEPLEQYQIQRMRSLVEYADHLFFYDSDIIDIIIEETQPFFDGQISAKETAERVQKSATEYMNEMLR